MFISPSEPEELRTIGMSSPLPETHGVDIMWLSRVGLVGVQRKEFPGDFLGSVQDGRLAQQISQMQGLDVAVLLLEGAPVWTSEGKLMQEWGRSWSRDTHRRYLWGVRARGVWVEDSVDLADTISVVSKLEEWSNAEHTSLDTRPGAGTGTWGFKATNRDWQKWFLQGVPGIGPELAEAILDKFGRVPMGLDVADEELLEVPGIGPKRVKRMRELLGGKP